MSTATKRTINSLSSLTDDERLDVLAHVFKKHKDVAGEALRLHQPLVNTINRQLRDEKRFDGPLQATPGTEEALMLRTDLGNNTQESFFYYPEYQQGILVVNTKAKMYAFRVDAETQVLTFLAPMNKDSTQTLPSCKLFDALRTGCPIRLFESRAGNKVEVVGTVTPDTSITAFWDVFHPTDDELKALYPGKAAHLLAKANGCAQFKFRLKMTIAPEANSELRRLMDLGGIPTVETTVTYPNGAGHYKGQWDEAGRLPHGRGTLVDANGVTYEGDWVNGKCHGHGTLTNNDKTVRYTGQWRDHMKHGRGEERIDDERYVGQFELNKRHGTGTVSLVDSGETVYEGEWKVGERDGHGTSYWNVEGVNTKRYEGGWKDGERHGQGIAYDAIDGQAVKAYEGEWEDGKRHGQGTMEYADGTRYEGDFKDGAQSGQGSLTVPDWGVYEGPFLNGLPNGSGKSSHPDGSVYEGDFKDGIKSGQGRVTMPDGGFYEGDFKDGTKSGQGRVTMPDGGVYEGPFLNGNPNGRGRASNSDGSVYEGDFKDGIQSGEGRLTMPDGEVYEGEWKGGKVHGKGRLSKPDGSISQGTWEYGKFVG